MGSARSGWRTGPARGTGGTRRTRGSRRPRRTPPERSGRGRRASRRPRAAGRTGASPRRPRHGVRPVRRRAAPGRRSPAAWRQQQFRQQQFQRRWGRGGRDRRSSRSPAPSPGSSSLRSGSLPSTLRAVRRWPATTGPEAIVDRRLVPVRRRLIVNVPFSFVRAVLLVDPAVGEVVGVDVPLAVADRPGAPVVGVAEMGRDVAPPAGPDVVAGPRESDGDAVRLRGGGEVDDGVGQVQCGFGQADELDGPGRGIGDDERRGDRPCRRPRWPG